MAKPTTAPPAPTTGGTSAPTTTAPPQLTADEIAIAVAAKIAAATPPTPTVKETDPAELQLLKSQLPTPTGSIPSFNIFVRVLNIADKGLNKRQVVFTCQGQNLSATTDSQGDADCPFNPIAAPTDGSELRVVVHVSGIRELSVMHIVQRRVKTPAQIARDARNNQRARFFLKIDAGSLIVCLLVALFFGLGKPLINQERTSLLPHPQTTLSREQVLFNSLSSVKGTDLEVRPAAATALSTAPWWTKSWQKPTFLAVLLFTAFAVLYGILSLREEVADAFRRGLDKLIDKHYFSARARDPFFQRLLAFSDHLRTARRPEATATAVAAPTSGIATPGAAPAATTVPIGHVPFWHLLRSDLVSDFVMGVLPGILKAIFKR